MLGVIVKKELKRIFTDRRLVFSAFILPAISIFIIYSLMGNLTNNIINDIEDHKSIVYIQNSPKGFNEYFSSIEENVNMSIQYITNETEIPKVRDDIKNGNVDLLIEFEDKFEEKVKNYDIQSIVPQIKTYYNTSEDYSNVARNKFVFEVLEGYESKILLDRFGNINYISAFDIDSNNPEAIIIDDKKASGQSLSMVLPMLIGILLFAGAMGIGMDTIAGEKERGTMTIHLLTPIKRETIAFGKVVSLGIIAIISALSSFVGILASMPFANDILTGGNEISIKGLFTPIQYLQLLLIMITLVGLYVGVICFLSIRARTVKEAGTYVSPVYMLIMIAAFSTMFSNGASELYQFAIPVYGSISALKAAFALELTMNQFLVTIASSVIITFVLIRLIARAFNDENVMLNA